jgi:predicted acetyltransferase
LFRQQSEEVYLRQLFVARDHRRQGIGHRAIQILRSDIWPKQKRLTVEVLVRNEGAVAFWRACGYRDYALTLEITPSV